MIDDLERRVRHHELVTAACRVSFTRGFIREILSWGEPNKDERAYIRRELREAGPELRERSEALAVAFLRWAVEP